MLFPREVSAKLIVFILAICGFTEWRQLGYYCNAIQAEQIQHLTNIFDFHINQELITTLSVKVTQND